MAQCYNHCRIIKRNSSSATKPLKLRIEKNAPKKKKALVMAQAIRKMVFDSSTEETEQDVPLIKIFTNPRTLSSAIKRSKDDQIPKRMKQKFIFYMNQPNHVPEVQLTQSVAGLKKSEGRATSIAHVQPSIDLKDKRKGMMMPPTAPNTMVQTYVSLTLS